MIADADSSRETGFEHWLKSPGPWVPCSVDSLDLHMPAHFRRKSVADLLMRVLESLHGWQNRFAASTQLFIALPDGIEREPIFPPMRQLPPESEQIYFDQLSRLFNDDPIFAHLAEQYQEEFELRVVNGEESNEDASKHVEELTAEASDETHDAVCDMEYQFIRTGTITELRAPLLVELPGIAPWKVTDDGLLQAIERRLAGDLAREIQQRAAVEGREPDFKFVVERNNDQGHAFEDLCAEKIWGPLSDAAVGAWLLLNWKKPYAMAAFRQTFDDKGVISFLREAYFAGVRLWFRRVTVLEFACRTVDDLRALERLCNAVLTEVPAAYARESPTSLLGDREESIVPGPAHTKLFV